MKPIDELRFWGKVERGEGCWRWTGRVDRGGYGLFSISRRTIVRAHRQGFTLAFGAPPAWACVLHRCGDRRCVNPAHLYLATAHERDGSRPPEPRVRET